MGSYDSFSNSVSRGTSSVTIATSLKLHDPEEIQRVANVTLREAMTSERSKRWQQVIQSYRHLTRILSKKNLPADVPPWYSMLMYEVYYHLGIAMQHIGEHRKAVSMYTKAIEAVFVPKNGCMAGCNSNSCLMTPLYARRAFSYAKAGDTKNALRDAEKAVVLDSKNPDVFCIRAMVRSTRNEIQLALQDVIKALKYNSNHLCALILRGRLAEPLIYDEWLDPGKKSENEDHKKACSINPDCHNFLKVQDFNHVNILAFYERFLYSLSVPHTVCEISLVRRKPHSPPSRVSSAKSTVFRVQAASSDSSSSSASSKPFRCGTPGGGQLEGFKVQRRRDYGEAVRDHVSRPKTATECIAYLEKQRLRKHIADARIGRLQRCSSYDALPVRSTSSVTKTKVSFVEPDPVQKVNSVKKASVFQEMNVKDAPRMYYRPWMGDKLPVAEVEKKQWLSTPFRV